MALPIRLKNGKTFLVETVEVPNDSAGFSTDDEDFLTRGRSLGDSPLAKLPAAELSAAIDVVEGIADEIGERLTQPGKSLQMSEIGLDVEVGFDAKGNVFIARASASASLKLSLKWKPGDSEG